MANKFVRGIREIRDINEQDFITNDQLDLLQDEKGEVYVHNFKDDKQTYYQLTNAIKTINGKAPSDTRDGNRTGIVESVNNYTPDKNGALTLPYVVRELFAGQPYNTYCMSEWTLDIPIKFDTHIFDKTAGSNVSLDETGTILTFNEIGGYLIDLKASPGQHNLQDSAWFGAVLSYEVFNPDGSRYKDGAFSNNVSSITDIQTDIQSNGRLYVYVDKPGFTMKFFFSWAMEKDTSTATAIMRYQTLDIQNIGEYSLKSNATSGKLSSEPKKETTVIELA